MSPRSRMTVTGLAATALAAVLMGCGGTTVEGEAPEVSPEPTVATATDDTPFAEERPVKPTGPVPPPPPPATEPEPMPGEPESPPAPEEPAPDQPAPPETVAGDFIALLEGRDFALPEGIDPVATATEACGRFDGGQEIDEVSGWLGEHGQLDPDQQGYFLGAAVGTFCPHNFPELG